MNKAKKTPRKSKPGPVLAVRLPKEISFYQVRWFQPDPGIHHTMNCFALAPARTVARELKAAGEFTRIGIYAAGLRLVE